MDDAAAPPFRERVAAFYRGRGYDVRQNARVRGSSENIYVLDMVATGPMGALLIGFGDAAGLDGQEIGRTRTLAKDVGATPVVAAASMSHDLRRVAAQLGVVAIDAATLDAPRPDVTFVGGASEPGDPAAELHPWPRSGRVGSASESSDLDTPLRPAKDSAPPEAGRLLLHPELGNDAGALTSPPLFAEPLSASPARTSAPSFSWLQPDTPGGATSGTPEALPATPADWSDAVTPAPAHHVVAAEDEKIQRSAARSWARVALWVGFALLALLLLKALF